MRFSSSLATSVVVLALAGCGGDDVPSVPTDAGRRDAGTGIDAGPLDGGRNDAGTLPDGAQPDGGELDAGGTTLPTCTFDPATDVFDLATDARARPRNVGVAAGALRLAVAWSAPADGFENIFAAEIPLDGDPMPVPITSEIAILRDPSIAASGDGWVLAWHGNPDDGTEIYARSWSATGAGGAIQRLTMRAGRDDATALLTMGSGVLAGWVETRDDTWRVAVTRALDGAAIPAATTRDATSATSQVSIPVLARLDDGSALAWVASTDAAAQDVVLQPLDATGSPQGPPRTISTEGNADGTVDAATGPSGSAVAFGVAVGGSRPEVRARRFVGSGAPSGPEQIVTRAPESGRDASITPLAGGFVVAFRALEGPTPMLRLALLDAELSRVSTLDVVEVAPTGGRITVRASGEGRLVIGWADVTTTTAIRAARVRCE